MCRIRMSLQTVLPCVYTFLCYLQIFFSALLEKKREKKEKTGKEKIYKQQYKKFPP